MKKFSLLLLSLAMLTACSDSEDPATVVPAENLVPIALRAAVDATTTGPAATKAAVEGNRFSQGNDVFRVMAYAGVTAPSTDWGSPYFGTTPVDCDAAGTPSFATVRYYPVDPAQKLYFYAWSPAENSLIAGTDLTAPSVRYTISGEEDIMAAQVTSGFDKTTPAGPSFRFEHKLMRVNFKLEKEAAFIAALVVNKIEIIGMKTSATLNIGTGELTFDDTPTRDLTVYDNPTGIAVTGTSTAAGNSPMIEPATSLKVRITAGVVVYPEIPVTLPSAAAGRNSTVTLTFRAVNISPASSVGR